MLLGFFACMFSLPSVGSWTLLSWSFLSQGLALFCILGLLLFPWRFYQRFFGITPFETFLFNVMGVGPALFTLLLWTNFLLHGEPELERYAIEEQNFIGNLLNPVYEFELEDGAYRDMPEFRRFEQRPRNRALLESAKEVEFRTARGLLGYRVMLERELLR